MTTPSSQVTGRQLYLQGLQMRFGKKRQIHFVKAAECFTLAAEKGHVRAMICLGYSYYNGEGVVIDQKAAFNHWVRAANQGNSHAEYLVGLCYEKGLGVSRHENNALYYYRRAGDQRQEDALQRLQSLQSKPYLQDVAIALKHREWLINRMQYYWLFVEDSSDLLGFIPLGLAYLTGYGVKPNYIYAANRLLSIRKFNDSIDPNLLCVIGKYMLKGQYFEKDEPTGQEFLNFAIKKGSKKALGILCAYYRKFKRHDDLYKMLNEEACLGNVYAYQHLSNCYKFGWGTEKDEELAKEYFSKAQAVPKETTVPKEYLHYPTVEAALEEIRRAEEYLSRPISDDLQRDALILHNLRLKL